MVSLLPGSLNGTGNERRSWDTSLEWYQLRGGFTVLTCFIKQNGTLQPLVVAPSGMAYVPQAARGPVLAQSQQVPACTGRLAADASFVAQHGKQDTDGPLPPSTARRSGLFSPACQCSEISWSSPPLLVIRPACDTSVEELIDGPGLFRHTGGRHCPLPLAIDREAVSSVQPPWTLSATFMHWISALLSESCIVVCYWHLALLTTRRFCFMYTRIEGMRDNCAQIARLQRRLV